MTTAPVRPWISRNATFAWLLRRGTTRRVPARRGALEALREPEDRISVSRLGQHVFRVRAQSVNGRRSSVNRFTWTITETPPPPPPTITSGPDGSTTSTDATFQFSVADGAAAECRLDDGLRLPARARSSTSASPSAAARLLRSRDRSGRRRSAPRRVARGRSRWERPRSRRERSRSRAASPGLLSPGQRRRTATDRHQPVRLPAPGHRAHASRCSPAARKPGCDGPANLQVTQSNTAGGSVSITVPALGSVTLPAQGATAPRRDDARPADEPGRVQERDLHAVATAGRGRAHEQHAFAEGRRRSGHRRRARSAWQASSARSGAPAPVPAATATRWRDAYRPARCRAPLSHRGQPP